MDINICSGKGINIAISETVKPEVLRMSKNISKIVRGHKCVGFYHDTNSRHDFKITCSEERSSFIVTSIAEADALGNSPIYITLEGDESIA